MRFSVADNPNNSVTEAALDAFKIVDVDCAVATFSTYGAGCASATSAPTMQGLTAPNLGTNYVLRTANLGAGPAAMILGLASDNTPLALAPFASGCTLLAQPDVVQTLNVFVNQAILSLPIPNDPSLAGLQLYSQAAQFGSTFTLSEGGLGTIN